MLSTGTRFSSRQSTLLLLGIGVATLAGLGIVIFVILYSHLLQPASTHLNPCTDFYKYSCAWWFGGIPLYGSRTWKQMRAIKNNTKELLTNNSFSTEENIKDVFDNARKMFQICSQNLEFEKDSGLKYLAAIVNQFNWPIIQSPSPELGDSIDFSSVVKLMGVIHKLGLSDGIFDFQVERSINPPHNFHIMVREKKMTLVERIHRYDHGVALEKDRENFKKFVSFAIDQIHGHPNDKETVEDIDEMLKFRELLLTAWAEKIARRVSDIKSREEIKLKSLTAALNINFTYIFQIMFENKHFSPDELVIVKNKNFLFRIATLLQNTPTRTVINLLVWNAIEPYLWGTNRALAAINDKVNPESHHIYYKRWTNANEILSSADKIPRWEKCVEAVSSCFPNTLHQAYVDFYIGKTIADAISDFTDHIIRTFIRKIDSWNWLDSHTKFFFKSKVENLKREFGLASVTEDELLLERSIASKDIFIANLLECRKVKTLLKLKALDNPSFIYNPSNTLYGTDVEHDYLTNSIKVLTGISQPPFFNPSQSSASNFGALGTLISSALLLIISSDGQKFDEMGEFNSSGWVPEINETYSKLANCFSKQYNEYCHNKRCNNFGERTLDSNIANEGGLRLAYNAYKSWVTKKPQDEGFQSKLAFVSFTQEQMFFLSFAMMYCAGDNPLIIQYLMSFEKESPPNILVNGPLSNMAEFSKAFNCPEKSEMIRIDRCELW